MKFIVCFLALGFIMAVSALTDEQKAKVKQITKECQEKTGISDEVLRKLVHGEYVKDDKTDAHILCFVQKTGVLNEAGQVQTAVLKTRLSGVISDEQKVNELVTSCGVQKDTPTDTAKSIVKCLKDAKESSGKNINLV